jgi:hypothetical protein
MSSFSPGDHDPCNMCIFVPLLNYYHFNQMVFWDVRPKWCMVTSVRSDRGPDRTAWCRILENIGCLGVIFCGVIEDPVCIQGVGEGHVVT